MPDKPDVAAILDNLREEVRARRQSLAHHDEQSAAYQALERQIHHSLEQLEITRVVSAHWPLSGRTLPQRGIAFVNRVVRRYLRWYINPIVDQQNEFNDVSARLLRLLSEAHSDLREQLAALKQERAKRTDSDHDDHDNDHDDRDSGGPGVALPADAPTAELQAMVDERGPHEPPAAFPDLTMRAALPQLSLHQTVNAHWPLEAHTPMQRAIVLVHKLVRRYLRWLINPIVEQQNSYNAALAQAVPLLIAADAETRAALAALRASDTPRMTR